MRVISDADGDALGQVAPWCSLITVTYNSRRALEEFWGNRDPLPQGVEWIVVDNGSHDGSAELAAELGATRVIRRVENLGFAASNNVGLEAARSDFIGFVNPDIRVNFADLNMLKALAAKERAVLSPQLLNADGTSQPNGRGFPLLWDKVRNRLGSEARLHDRYLLYSANAMPRKVCWLMGASIFGMREVIDAIGSWDPYFFLYYEDSDFCLRAWKSDVDVLLVPAAQWTHGWARETSKFRATPWKRELASMFKFYVRYPEFLMPRPFAARIHSKIEREMCGADQWR